MVISTGCLQPVSRMRSRIGVTETTPTTTNKSSAEAKRTLRRAVVAAGGGVTVLVGLALLPLPGPGTLVILAGLTVLRKEFPRAGHAADKIKGAAVTAVSKIRRPRGSKPHAAGPSRPDR
jgi:hypothetical protein